MNLKKLVNHFFELGHLKRTVRSGQRAYLEPDFTDNVAAHSFRVAAIAWHLASMFKGVDQNKVAAMALFHDLGETRSGDLDWTMKRYVSVNSDKLLEEQTEGLDNNLYNLMSEYEARDTIEAKIVKDADVLELVLTLKELEFKGNKEAAQWLYGKGDEDRDEYRKLKYLSTDEAKSLGREIYHATPTAWWDNIWTDKSN